MPDIDKPENNNSTNEPINLTTFFSGLDSQLKQMLLLEVDDEVINSLPPGLAVEAYEIRKNNFGNPDFVLDREATIISQIDNLNLNEQKYSSDNVAKRSH